MKVLILSVSTGQDHYATAKALANRFESLDVDCEIMDVYGEISKLVNMTMSHGYLISTTYAPRAYHLVYQMMDKVTEPSSPFSITRLVNRVMTEEIKDLILEKDADYIISTHVLASCMMSNLRRRGFLEDTCVINIVTDYTIHPLWQETGNLDYFVVGSELLSYSLERKNISAKKMLPFGIPVHKKFSKRTEQSKAREMLELKPDVPTLLVMSGSMGYGHIENTIETLDSLPLVFQIMVVCGNNKALYRDLKQNEYEKDVHIYGFVDNVDLMMDASDCIITKPGGLTTSEALAKGLPMIMINPIPGHEHRNVEFMLNNGLGLYATKTFPIDEAVYNLFSHPRRVETIRQTIDVLAKRDATFKLTQFVVDHYADKNTEN